MYFIKEIAHIACVCMWNDPLMQSRYLVKRTYYIGILFEKSK